MTGCSVTARRYGTARRYRREDSMAGMFGMVWYGCCVTRWDVQVWSIRDERRRVHIVQSVMARQNKLFTACLVHKDTYE